MESPSPSPVPSLVIPPEAQRLRAELANSAAELYDHEVFWRDKGLLLESRGYVLRPRYRVGWIPSWVNSDIDPLSAEDFHSILLRPNIMDATRVADGKVVIIKRMNAQRKEGEIAKLFSQEPLKNDPKNHCVPILDMFQDDEDKTIAYMVMPLLRRTDDPPFTALNDVVELIDQLLEGLVFMHAQGVAHRDCAYQNLLMDATSIYPDGFHPLLIDRNPDASDNARVISRYLAPRPVKYYFADFGISTHFTSKQKERLVTGDDGLDRTVPELSCDVPYDPFKVDIFVLGNFFRQHIFEAFSNVDFLKPLIESMTSHDPAARPEANVALRQWRKIRRGLGIFERGMPLLSYTEDEDEDEHEVPIPRAWIVLYLIPIIIRRELRAVGRWLHIIPA